MLLRTEGGLLAVRVVGEEKLVYGLPDLAAVLGEGHVLLFIDGLQLCMETADDAVTEALRLDAGPVVYLVGGDVFLVDGLIRRREGIGAVCAYHGHEFVVLVGDGVAGCLIAYGIYGMVYSLALRRVCGYAIDLIEALNLVQEGFLRLVVLGAVVLRALEHEVLEVVGEAGGLRRVVLAADADGDVGLDTGLLLVDGHEYLEPVGESVDFGVERVVFYGLVFVAGNQGDECHGKGNQKSFHKYTD